MKLRWPCRKVGICGSCPLTNKITEVADSRDNLKPRDVTLIMATN